MRIGICFQHFNPFPNLTIFEKVRLCDQAHKYPSQLSGGQLQRVAIARTLCMMTRMIFFEDPKSALDPEMIGEVFDTLDILARDGLTIHCVTHEMGFAKRFADQVAYMGSGEIVGNSPPNKYRHDAINQRLRKHLGPVMH